MCSGLLNGSDSVAYNLLARALFHKEKSSLIVPWGVLRNRERAPPRGQVRGRFEVVSLPTPRLEGLVSTHQWFMLTPSRIAAVRVCGVVGGWSGLQGLVG